MRITRIRASIDAEMDVLVGRTDYDQMTFAELAAASEDALSNGAIRAETARRVSIDEAIARKQDELAPRMRRLWTFLIVGGVSLVGAVALTFGPTPTDPNWALAFVVGRALLWITASAVGATVLVFFVQSASPSALGSPSPRTPGHWREAELRTAAWLTSRGEAGVRTGSGIKDGGVDVETQGYVVQVKDWVGNVGGPAVRQIHGVAAARNKRAMVVARSGFTADAIRFARDAGVELYVFGSGAYRRI